MAAYTVELTGPQLRVLCDILNAVTNAPDPWEEYVGPRDWKTLGRAADVLNEGRRTAQRAESTPAVGGGLS